MSLDLDRIRDAVIKKIDHCKRDLARWQKKLEVIDGAKSVAKEIEKEIDAEIILMSDDDSEKTRVVNDAYAGLGMTTAVLEAFQQIGFGRPVTLAQLKEHLLKYGFKPPKHFAPSLNATLNRLAERNAVVKKQNKEGQNTFQVNSGPDES